jgi:1-deoxy-D-xylulose-5-phosphate reductoisomerase
LRKLDFEEVPPRKFRCFELAKHALRQGGAMPCALNAADEIAVAAFLDGRLSFPGIAEAIEHVLDEMPGGPLGSIDDVLAADAEARRLARIEVMRRQKGARRN